jgi:hypothetical protein
MKEILRGKNHKNMLRSCNAHPMKNIAVASLVFEPAATQVDSAIRDGNDFSFSSDTSIKERSMTLLACLSNPLGVGVAV